MPSRPVYQGWLAVFLITLAVYAATANRGAQWQDSGAYILSITTGELKNPLGLALTHPLHYGLGRLALQLLSFVEPSAAITWVSSFAAALAVANVYGAARCLTGSGRGALFAAASLAVAHSFWRLATVAEVYPVSTALLAGECWCLVAFLKRGERWYLWGALLHNGLGIANHLQGGLTTPVLALVTLLAVRTGRIRYGAIIVGTLLWLLGTLPYSGMVLHQCLTTGNWSETLGSALFGNRGLFQGSVLNIMPPLKYAAITLGFTLLSYPNLFLPAAAYGVVGRQRPEIPTSVRRALLAGLVIHAFFALRYNVIDQYTFMLPTYVFLALFAAVGASAFARRAAWPDASPPSRATSPSPGDRQAGDRRSSPAAGAAAVLLLSATPGLYAIAPLVTRYSGLLEKTGLARHKPYRDDDVYLFVPWACADHSAEQMSRQAVSLAGSDGLILVADPMGRDAVRYRVIRDGRAGIEVRPFLWRYAEETLKDATVAWRANRRVVFVPDDVRKPLPAGVTAERHGDLYLMRAVASPDADKSEGQG